MITLETAENALKNVYLGTVTEIMNTKINPLLAKIEQTSEDVWGKEIHTCASVGINGGFGAGSETDELPEAASNRYVEFVSTLKNLYGKIEISDKAVRASAEGKGAFTDLLNAEIEGLIAASKFNFGRMLYGDGSGKLCTVQSTSGSNAVIVDDVRNLIEGMVVDCLAGGDYNTYGLRIKSIDRDNKKVTFNTSASLGGSEEVYVQGSMNKEITGVEALFGDSAYLYGNLRSSIASILPKTKNLNAQLGETTIQEAIDGVENVSNAQIDFIGVSADVKYAYQEFMAQFKRNIDVMELDGGYKTLSYNGIPVVYDRFIPNGTMYLLDTRQFRLHQLCDWRFIENGNGKILRQRENRPTYIATLVKYCDLVCKMPLGQAKITGIKR